MLIMSIFVPGVFAAASDIQFSGYTWFRDTGNNQIYSDEQTNTSKMSIERAYMTWKMSYEDNLAGNLTLDIPMKSGNTTNDDWTAFVKSAYVDILNLLPEGGFARFGQQPVYFAMIDKWQYPMIYKNLEDNLGLISSADLGMSLQGYFPGGWADYQVAAYGGNGYAKPTETDNNTATDISLGLYPLPGLSIRGSLYNSLVGSSDATTYQNTVTGKWYNGLAVNYYAGPLWFMWEGVDGMKPNAADTQSYHVQGNSKLVMWTINDKWDIGVREDVYNPDVDNQLYSDLALTGNGDIRTNSQDLMIYAVNYHWTTDLLFQLNSSKLTYACGNQLGGGATPYNASTNAAYTQYQTVFQVKWSY